VSRRVFAALVVLALACRAIPAPANGVLALSEVRLPAPAVVLGDTLRDSTGRAAKLTLVAFGLGGDKDTIKTVTSSFVVLDRGAHITADGYVIGDSVRATPVRIVGTVGTLQTSAANLSVIPHPDSLASAVTFPIAPIKFNILDSTAQANFSVAIAATVMSTSVVPPSAVQSVIVQFTLASQPRGLNGASTGVLVDDGGIASTVDTSDASGLVSRRIRLRPAALAAPSATDSFVVLVAAQYRGVALTGSPLRFVVPVQPGSVASTRIP
jgi:hypothetical protein